MASTMPLNQGHSAHSYLSDHAGAPTLTVSPPLKTSAPAFFSLRRYAMARATPPRSPSSV
jgi:hypothetical protein